MQLRNRKLSFRDAVLVLVILAFTLALAYSGYTAVRLVWHRRQVRAAIPEYLKSLAGQRDLLASSIERYRQHFGYYPQNHGTNAAERAVLHPLYYELVGTRWFPQRKNFGIPTAKETTSQEHLREFFGMASFSNCLTFPDWPTNFMFQLPMPGREDRGVILPCGVVPEEITAELDQDFDVSNWRYAADPATHNPGKFDLWIELNVLGQHFTVANWLAGK